MSDTYWIISAVIAVLFGISFALRVMERFLTQSNNVGDYVGKFSDFCRKFVVVGEVWHLMIWPAFRTHHLRAMQ